MKMDAMTRKVLAAYAVSPSTEPADLATELAIGEEVVRHKLAVLRDGGVIQDVSVRVNGNQVGYPYEAFILAVPSAQTTREELESLAASSLVTRMFTLATRRSIAFTVLGTHPDEAFQRGETLAAAAHLEDVASVMMVDTLADNPGAALAHALTHAPPKVSTPDVAEPVVAGQETP